MANFCRKPDFTRGSSYTGTSTTGTVDRDMWITMTHLKGANNNTAKFYMSKDGNNWILVSASAYHASRGNTSGCSMFYFPKGWHYQLESNYNQQLTFWECL